VPGGFMPDKLRRDARVLSLTRKFFESGKLVVHCPQTTGGPSIQFGIVGLRAAKTIWPSL
jgi:hypothetical protein